MTTRAVLAGMLLVPLTLAGCSADTAGYCGTLEEQQRALTDLAAAADDPGTDVVGQSLSVFVDLRDAAPDDIRDEWDTYVFAWQGLADAFDAAGADPGDYRPGEGPAVVGEERAAAIEDAAAELRAPRVVDAGLGIEQHARDVCKVDLGLAGEGP